MEFFRDIYLGESVSLKVEQILKKLNNGKTVPNLFLITMSENPDNMLEIVPQWEVMQKGYPNTDIKVVGLANGKKEAIALVQFIIEQVLQETGSANARDYLRQRWEGQA